MDVNIWLKKFTLDAVGLAAFDEDFGQLQAREGRLTHLVEQVGWAGSGRAGLGLAGCVDGAGGA